MSSSQEQKSKAVSQISTTEPNWGRERLERWWEPSKQLLRSIRNYQRVSEQTGAIARIMRFYHVLEHRFWSVVTASDIPLNCQVGGGLVLPHPNGIVIHPSAVIGVNCTIFQQVTIVNRVRIGGQVDIGAGAKILRYVTIGDRAKIGANAVVLKDVPPGATAVGVPARIVPARLTPTPTETPTETPEQVCESEQQVQTSGVNLENKPGVGMESDRQELTDSTQ